LTAPDERPWRDLRALLHREGAAIALISFAAFLGNGMLFPVLPLYLDHLGASGTVVGLGLALLGLGEGLCGFSWGVVADHRGVAIPLAVFVAGSVLAYAGLALLPVIAAALAFRFVLAALGAAIWPAGRGYFVRAVPVRSKGLAVAAFAVMIASGMSVGGFLSGAIVGSGGFGAVFWTLAAVTAAIGAVAIPRLRFTPPGPPPAAGGAGPPARARGIITPPVLTVGAIVALVAGAYGSVLSFVPLLMAKAGLPAGRVGAVFGVGTAASLLILPFAGHFADRARRRTMIGALAAYALAIAALAVARGFWPVLLATTLMFLSRWAGDPAMVALLSDVVPPHLQGRAQGLHVIAFDLGLVGAPAIAGALWDRWGPPATFGFAALLAAAALGVATLRVPRGEWRNDGGALSAG
jgi:MFS family permease